MWLNLLLYFCGAWIVVAVPTAIILGILMHRAPIGREMPGVGFVRDEAGKL